MICYNCARRTLGTFVRSITNIEPVFSPRYASFTATRPPQDFPANHKTRTVDRPRHADLEPFPTEEIEEDFEGGRKERPAWAIQKEALKAKFGGDNWNPRKKLSPDTLEGIRHLHATKPDQFTTPVLANHFKISPEAIRRILKSKWRPSEAEYEARMQRWDKRGERIWTNLVEMGVKPPKRWREMGVGRAQKGERPNWKIKGRTLANVRDGVSDEFRDFIPNDDIIPIVDSKGRSNKVVRIPLSQRV